MSAIKILVVLTLVMFSYTTIAKDEEKKEEKQEIKSPTEAYKPKRPDTYTPNTGDPVLDEMLLELNKLNEDKIIKVRFTKNVKKEFNFPEHSIDALFRQYEFTIPDVLMILSIADNTGQPMKNISGAYYKNYEKGWKHILYIMNVDQGTPLYDLIVKDVENGFIK